jgi:hypothetical protein
MSVDPVRRAHQALPHAELPARMAHPLPPFPRFPSRRSRSNRHPFTPSSSAGPYRLPRDVRDRLAASLAPFRNRDAAFALATFLGRFWSTPSRLLTAFPIDRRALAGNDDLGLTEARVRGAIRTLELVGFLDRAVASGSPYQRTAEGELHRKPMLYQFGGEYGPAFGAANKRAGAARGRQSAVTRSSAPASSARPSAARATAATLKSPKSKSEAEHKVLMGEVMRRTPESSLQKSALDSAVERWRKAFEESRQR